MQLREGSVHYFNPKFAKLDRKKTDIEVEIRNSGSNIIKFTEEAMGPHNDKTNKKLRKQNVFLFILIGLALIGIILKFV